MKKRLIDADALSDAVDKSKRNNPHPQGMIRVNHRNEHDHFLRMILDAPTVDAVEVVRCKDCNYWNNPYCNHSESTMLDTQADNFCSYGERKEERK